MPMGPLPTEFRVNEFASTWLVAKMQPDSEFSYDKMTNVVPVDQPTGLYHTFPEGSYTRTEAEFTGYGAPAPYVDMHYGQDQYNARTFRLGMKIVDDIKYQERDPINMLQDTTTVLARKMKLKKELMFNQAFIRPGLWTGFKPNGVSQDFDCTQLISGGGYSRGPWNLPNSNPELDMQFAQENNYGNTGLRAMDLYVTRDVYAALRQHPILKDDIKYTQAGFGLNESLIAQALGVDNIYVMSAILNTAQQGQPDNIGFMTRNCALLVYRSDMSSRMMVTAMSAFSYSGDPNVKGLTGTVASWYDNETRSTKIVASAGVDFKIVCSDCGVFFKNVLQE
jgi:hypothetical protein